MKVLAVLPCRLGSKRLPEKPLVKIADKPLVQHVYESVLQAKRVDRVIIATDSPFIADASKDFGADVLMTSKEHLSGSDRVSEVAAKFPSFDIVLNIQVDAILIKGEMIDMLAEPLLDDKNIMMTALKSEIVDENELLSPNIVKVVTDKNNFALYYSRSKIPFAKNSEGVKYFKNMGMYGFRRQTLLQYYGQERTPLEKAEALEQLRVLENGGKIYVVSNNLQILDISAFEDGEKAKDKYNEYYKKNR